ncbi:MAG: PilN domain-containing protein [Candidatus Omnitrophica bacterium]|nr:PilN domain-containing protein [Candidatus Omnitrophota bacterium]
MRKIAINLSPQKENITSAVLQNLVSYTPLVGLTAGVVLVILLFLQVFIAKQTYTYNGYEKKWKKLESKYNLLKGIKEEANNLKEEKENLERVATPEHNVVLILEDIFSSLPKNIWFDGLNFEGEAIDIRGYVAGWNEDYLISLGGFINSLREKDYFSSKFSRINIRKSARESYNGVETLKFSIECKK